jgi:predicted CoA-binding protein
MTPEAAQEFLAQKTYAVVGVSRGGGKFGNAVMNALKRKGYRIFPVNPKAKEIDGEPCYPNLKALPEPVGGVIFVVPPAVTEKAVRVAADAGIKRVWMQPGAESDDAVDFCRKRGIAAVYNRCIMRAV